MPKIDNNHKQRFLNSSDYVVLLDCLEKGCVKKNKMLKRNLVEDYSTLKITYAKSLYNFVCFIDQISESNTHTYYVTIMCLGDDKKS